MCATSSNRQVTSPTDIQPNREYEFTSPDECLYCDEKSWHSCQYCAKPTLDPPIGEAKSTSHIDGTAIAPDGCNDSSPGEMTDDTTSSEGQVQSSSDSDENAVEDEVMRDYSLATTFQSME
ncbi:MAG: hypothetical protein Q9210_000701 [Variospora velana]